MHKKYAIIVAGGVGSRMGNTLPKQYLLLQGKPILMHTIERFAFDADINIVVVIHHAMEDYWNNCCKEHSFGVPHTIVYGGQTRFQSVRNAVNFITAKEQDPSQCIVAIHDAARPLISPALIKKAYQTTATVGASVVAISSTNSIRMGNTNQNEAADRSKIWLVQTPQTFTGNLLVDGFKQAEEATFTDDATVIEKLGHPIHIIEGDHRNIKITYPEDIDIAMLYLKRQEA